MKNKKFIIATAVITLGLAGLAGCSESEKVSYNVSKDADNFKVRRRVVVINTRTDKVEMQAEGLISVDIKSHQLDIIARTGANSYRKDIVNLTGNNMYSITQIDDSNVSKYGYEITWIPESIVPIRVKGE